MDLYIDREELLRALGRSQGIVERHTTNLALSHVLLSAQEGRLRVTASDTQITLVADYPARIEREGELTVEAQTFFQIIRTLGEPTVHLFATGNNRLGIQCGRSEFKVVSLPAEDYPQIATQDATRAMRVKGGDLRRIIEETLFSVSTDESRFGLNGTHLEEVTAEDGSRRLRMVTTDGSRLSWSEAPYEGDFAMGSRMLLPRKGLEQVRRLVEDPDEVWSIGFGERSASFTTETLRLFVGLVEGEFPDYRQVLPSSHSRRVELDRAAFDAELKRIAIMASDRNHSARFDFQEDKLILSATSVDTGDARTEVAAELEGEPLQTGFNISYFRDILQKVAPSEKIVLEMGEALDPCIVRFPGRDDCRFVVMPMRLD